jgi:hypothetical protein
MLLKLIMGHALADFALQSDAMAKGKNRHNKTTPPPGQKYVPCWPYWLIAHALIHGGVVWLITNSPMFGCLETLFHFCIDGLKCEGVFNPHHDQFLHVVIKFIYSVALFGASL